MSSVVENYAPSVEEQAAASAVKQAFELEQNVAGPQLVTADGLTVEIPHGLANLFEVVARAAAAGERISVRFGGEQLSPREAAEELGVSRTYLCRLMDQGEIAFERVGSHRRVNADELERYRAVRAERMASGYREAVEDVADAPDAPMPEGPRVRRKRPSR